MGLHEECTVVWTWCPAGPTPCGSSLARGFRWNLRGSDPYASPHYLPGPGRSTTRQLRPLDCHLPQLKGE